VVDGQAIIFCLVAWHVVTVISIFPTILEDKLHIIRL